MFFLDRGIRAKVIIFFNNSNFHFSFYSFPSRLLLHLCPSRRRPFPPQWGCGDAPSSSRRRWRRGRSTRSSNNSNINNSSNNNSSSRPSSRVGAVDRGCQSLTALSLPLLLHPPPRLLHHPLKLKKKNEKNPIKTILSPERIFIYFHSLPYGITLFLTTNKYHFIHNHIRICFNYNVVQTCCEGS